MGLFSFFRKNKQESASGQGEYTSRSGDDAQASRSRAKRKSAKNDVDSAEVPEKKRARRRLIGAIVLVSAVVVVLPMIFDPEPNPKIDDIVIQIPSRDHAANNTDVAVAPDVAAQNRSAASTDQDEEIVSEPIIEEAPAASQTETTPAPAVTTPTPIATPKPVPVVTPPPAKPVVDEAARAMAILEGRTPHKPAQEDKSASAATGKVVIQVAALASQEKVTELRKKLSDAGIKSFTQKIATPAGERTRIRVGPFASREEAEKTRAKINKLGLGATIVPA